MTRFAALGACVALFMAAPAAAENDMFIVHQVEMERAEAVAAIRDHVEEDDDWLFLAEFGLAGGAATALKICYVPLGPDLIAAGMHIMAMMPCGNMAFYENDEGETMLSMLDLSFMTALTDDLHVQNAAAEGAPAFAQMLQETLGVE